MADAKQDPDAKGPAPARQPWFTRHLWQIQPIRDILVFAAIFGVLYLGYVLRPVTVPLLLALLLAYLLEPVVCKLERSRHFTRQGAVSGILVAVVVFVAVPAALATAFAVVQGVSFAQTVVDSTDRITTVTTYVKNHEDDVLPRYDKESQTISFYAVEPASQLGEPVPAGEGPEDPAEGAVETRLNTADSRKAERAFAGLPDVLKPVVYGYARRTVDTADGSGDIDGTADTIAQLFDWGLGIIRGNAARMTDAAVQGGRITLATGLATVTSIGMLLFGLFLTGFFFYFLSTGYAKVRGFGYEVLPHQHRDQIVDLLRQMDRVVAGFVRGRITIAIIQSVIFTIAYWLIGVPAPLIFGPLVGILSIVPYVALLGIPLTITALALDNSGWFAFQGTWWWTLGAPVAVYFAGQAVDDYLLTPAIQGKATNMDTPTILFASLAGGILAGVYGLLLAIPVAACVKILLRELFWPRFHAWLKGEEKDFLPLRR
ncbi:MAG: AI-2E family transporter [Phycisphaerales bacterium]